MSLQVVRGKKAQRIMAYDLEVTYLLKTSQLLFNNMSHLGNSEKKALTQVLGGIFSSHLKVASSNAFIFSMFIFHCCTEDDLAHDRS